MPFPRLRSHAGARIALAGLLPLLGGTTGCVSPPSPREVLAVGFRTPEQCWTSFQTAVRADEPALEYRCLSQRLIREQGLSQLAWREARDEFYRPLGTRWAITRARMVEPARVEGNHAVLVVEGVGRRVRLEFLREDFQTLRAGERLIVDEEADFAAASGVQGQQGQRWFYAQVPLPQGTDAAGVSELHLGREWKLDRISDLQDP